MCKQMKNAPMLDFPVEEYEQRHRRLQAQLAQQGLAGAVFTSRYNVRYWCGFQSVVWVSKISTPGILIVSADGRKRLIGSHSAYESMRYTTCLEDGELMYYGASRDGKPHPASYRQAIVDTLREFGMAGEAVGMELGTTMRLHINMNDYRYVLDESRICPRDFTPAIWKIRSVKSPAEIEQLAHCARISEKAYEAAFASIDFDASTEQSINTAYCAEAYRLGAERQEPMIVCFGPGRYNAGNCPPSQKRVTRIEHAVLTFDGGPIYRGYYSDTIRQGVVGSLSPRQQEYAKMSQEVLDYTLSNIRAGANAREVMAKQDAYVDKHGYGDVYKTRGWTGHGIGLEIHEPPTISSDCDWTLEEGNVLAVEPDIGDEEWGGFAHEENVVVTKDGCRLLTDFLPGVKLL